MLYLLQHLLKCGECGHNFHARSTWTTTSVRNGKKYQYDLPTPRRYYDAQFADAGKAEHWLDDHYAGQEPAEQDRRRNQGVAEAAP